MGTHVSLEIGSRWEGLQADGTLKGTIGGVNAQVSLQSSRLHIGRMALIAAVWPLPRVDSLVDRQIASAGKCLGTMETLKGAFSRMGADMLIESTALCECLDAVGTLVRPLAGVGSYVIGQIARVDKFLGTMRTLMFAFAGMESLVKIHFLFTGEFFAADRTSMQIGIAFDQTEHQFVKFSAGRRRASAAVGLKLHLAFD